MGLRSNQKPALGQRSTLIKHVTSTSYKLQPAIWSHDTGQWIAWFDRCQLIITWCHICEPSREKGAYENFTIRLISPSQPWNWSKWSEFPWNSFQVARTRRESRSCHREINHAMNKPWSETCWKIHAVKSSSREKFTPRNECNVTVKNKKTSPKRGTKISHH